MSPRRMGKKILLPLLNVLKDVKPEQRIIILAHLDNVTRDALYSTINNVLHNDRIAFRKRLFLKSKLKPFKDEFRFLADKNKSLARKKKKLAQVGGKPLTHVIRAAIPLLLNLYR